MNKGKLILILIILFVACTRNPVDTAGGTSTTGNSISGVVQDSVGNKIADAPIRLRDKNYVAHVNDPLYSDFLIINSSTDSEGAFTIKSVPAGEYVMEVFIDSTYGQSVDIELPVNSNTVIKDLTLEVQDFGFLSGVMQAVLSSPQFTIHVLGTEHFTFSDSTTGDFSLSLPSGKYDLLIIPEDPTFQAQEIYSVVIHPNSNTSLGNIQAVRIPDQAVYQAKIFINTSSTGADISEDLHQYPLSLRLNGSNLSFDKLPTHGNEFRFYRNGISLPFEIEIWNPSSESAQIWVKMDTLYRDQKDQFINVYWGPGTSELVTNSETVFNNSDFNGIWHFEESSTGILGPAKSFNGIDDYLEIPENSYDNLNEGTISTWVRLNSYGPQTLIGKQLDGINTYGLLSVGFHPDSGGLFQGAEETGKVYFHALNRTEDLKSSDSINNNEWTHVSVSFSSSQATMYINGIESASMPGNYSIPFDSATTTRIGSWGGMNSTNGVRTTLNINGSLDEMRISSKFRSASWHKMNYESQKLNSSCIRFEIE